MFTREELQHIRNTALEEAPLVSEPWRIVLYRLANAADHLDAKIAQRRIKEDS